MSDTSQPLNTYDRVVIHCGDGGCPRVLGGISETVAGPILFAERHPTAAERHEYDDDRFNAYNPDVVAELREAAKQPLAPEVWPLPGGSLAQVGPLPSFGCEKHDERLGDLTELVADYHRADPTRGVLHHVLHRP